MAGELFLRNVDQCQIFTASAVDRRDEVNQSFLEAVRLRSHLFSMCDSHPFYLFIRNLSRSPFGPDASPVPHPLRYSTISLETVAGTGAALVSVHGGAAVARESGTGADLSSPELERGASRCSLSRPGGSVSIDWGQIGP